MALAPGIFAWISGRRLVAAIDDPAFPERHFARSRALGTVSVLCFVIAPILVPAALWWAGPVLVLGVLAGAFPARRRIFGERWSLGAYMRFSIFSGIGMIGFWVLLAFTPAVIVGVADVDVRLGGLVAATVAVLLVICQMNYPRFWLAMHRAAPLHRPDLAPMLDAIVARARGPAPAIYRFGAPGGYVMNAVALPHAKRPAVAFGDAVLEQLEPKEIVAVFAHEVAHLEHFDAVRLRHHGLVGLVLIVMATALVAALVAIAPSYATWLTLGITITIVGTLVMLSSRSQANETASDLRAVELTGDPDALISALTRLHMGLRLPRQWPHEVETSLSHPSLARRIQAIRERAAVELPALERATIARTPSGGSRIALDESRAYFFDGLTPDTPDDLSAMREQASSYRALAYAEMSELRLIATANGRALKARDLTGKAWIVSLRADDVPAVDRALAVVDARLGRRRKEKANANAQLLAIASLVALLAAGQIGVVLVPILMVLARPSAAAVSALGAMAVGRVVAVVAGSEVPTTMTGLLGLVGLGLAGAAALWLAWRDVRASRDARHRPDARAILIALGATAAAVLVMFVPSATGTPLSLSLANPLVTALAVVGLGIGAALMPAEARAHRRAGAALATVATLLVLINAQRTIALRGPSLRVDEGVAERVTEVALETGGYRLELAPGGKHYAVQGIVGSSHAFVDEDEVSFRWTLGAIGGGTRVVEAMDLAFIDDDMVLLMAWHEDSIVVESDTVPGGTRHVGRFWRRRLPPLIGPQLIVDRTAGRWTVFGRLETGELAAFSGVHQDPRALSERRWPADTVWMQPLQAWPDGSLIAYSLTSPRDRVRSAISLLAGPSLRFDVWRSSDGVRTRVGSIDGVPVCQVSGAEIVCAGRGSERTQIWRLIMGGRGQPVGVLPEGYDIRSVGDVGPLVAIERTGGSVILVDGHSGKAQRVRLAGLSDSEPAIVIDAKAMGSVLATLEVRAGETRLGVYRAH